MPLHPRRCSFLYSVSCLLDALDGIAARRFQQSTRFGAVLDMVTDRCTTTCLLVFLATAKPAYSMIFQGLISLDLASHYMHMYATLAMGGQTQSHKNVSPDRSRIMNLYYSNKVRSRTYSYSASSLTRYATVGALHMLRPQRTLLHRTLPPLLLLAHHHTRSSPTVRQRDVTHITTAAHTITPLPVALLGRRYGDGKSEQDGQHSALDTHHRERARHGSQTVYQRCAACEGLALARGG